MAKLTFNKTDATNLQQSLKGASSSIPVTSTDWIAYGDKTLTEALSDIGKYSTGTSTVAGITKLYNSTGTNTDGAMTQSAVTTELNKLTTSIGNIVSFSASVVTALPAAASAKDGVIYLISNGGKDPNIYDEYIKVGDKLEKIGSTDIDVSGKQDKTFTLNAPGYSVKTTTGEGADQQVKTTQIVADEMVNDSNLESVVNSLRSDVNNIMPDKNLTNPDGLCYYTLVNN